MHASGWNQLRYIICNIFWHYGSTISLENADGIGILQKFIQQFRLEKQIPSANMTRILSLTRKNNSDHMS